MDDLKGRLLELTEQEQAFLADVAEKTPELLEDVQAAMADGGGLILVGDEVVGFAFPPHWPTDPNAPVVEARIVDE